MSKSKALNLRAILYPRPFQDRRQEVLVMIAQGMNTKTIALALDISTKTVEYHRQKIYEATGLSNAVDLTHFALKHNLIKIREDIP